MACFLVPAAEAAVTTIIAKAAEATEEKKAVSEEPSGGASPDHASLSPAPSGRSLGKTFLHRLNWLSGMLWGGAVLLLLEHIWHGEVVPWWPFLTAASDPVATADMLHEMATAGVGMAVLVTAVWVGMVLVSAVVERREANDMPAAKEDLK